MASHGYDESEREMAPGYLASESVGRKAAAATIIDVSCCSGTYVSQEKKIK